MTGSPAGHIDALLRPEIRALSAYHVPPAADVLKLDAMENPYSWPGALEAEWLASLRGVTLNRYPLPHPAELVQALAR